MPRASPANLAHQSGRRTETGDSRDGGPAAGGCADCGPRAGAVQLCLDRLPGAPAALVSPDQPVAGGGGEPAGGVAGCGGRLLRGPAAAAAAGKSQRAIQQLQEQLEREQGNMLLNQIRSHFFYHTLNALQALIVLKPEAAYKMAGDFAATCGSHWTPSLPTAGSAPSGRRSGRSGPMRISTSSSWGTGCTWSTRFPTWTFPSPC